MADSFRRDCQSFRCLGFGEDSKECMGSVSSILSSAMVSILALHTDATPVNVDSTETVEIRKNKNISMPDYSKQNNAKLLDSEINPVDFKWLLERCDNDNELTLKVLRVFVEQGNDHVTSLQKIYNSAMKVDLKIQEIVFHAVIFSCHRCWKCLSPLTLYAQNFLAGSACNVGARHLEHCSLELYHIVGNLSIQSIDPSQFEAAVPIHLIEQVAHSSMLAQTDSCWPPSHILTALTCKNCKRKWPTLPCQ